MSTSSFADGNDLPPFSPELFRGKSVLVTGGTSGIGLAIAGGFAKFGAQVIATGATAREVEDAQITPGIDHQVLDVRDGDATRALVQGIARLDVVVNCIGVIRRHEELDPDVFAQVLDINLTGTMRVCAAARPALARTCGTVVNTASMLSFFGGGLVPGYAASKGGVAQLTKSLAIAYAEDGIRVNTIAPGWIETRLTAALREDEARKAAIQSRIALKRWGSPSDVVAAALFLASSGAAYITGTILPVDGGYLAV